MYWLFLCQDLRECFETQSVGKLQGALAKMSKEDATYHMKRCVDSGLWVPDARSKGEQRSNARLDGECI